jgi:methylated-DNA-protein-cysteine methyltransferase-like protein
MQEAGTERWRGEAHCVIQSQRDTFRDRIYAVAARIPRGRVATYGDVARLAGKPGGAREVGWALHSLPAGSAVPWWRVINAQGGISPRPTDPHGCEEQARLLRAEGIRVSAGTLDLERYRWDGE